MGKNKIALVGGFVHKDEIQKDKFDKELYDILKHLSIKIKKPELKWSDEKFDHIVKLKKVYQDTDHGQILFCKHNKIERQSTFSEKYYEARTDSGEIICSSRDEEEVLGIFK